MLGLTSIMRMDFFTESGDHMDQQKVTYECVNNWYCHSSADRYIVLRLAHDVPMAEHMGITRTKNCLLHHYHWPGIFTKVTNYCRSCEVCRKNNPRHPPKAKMMTMPWIEQAFKRIAITLHSGRGPVYSHHM